jgi:long-chain acyl-CoA synthetase
MTDRTVLDLYRHDVDAPRGNHYSHWTPGGRRSLTTGEFLRRTCALADALGALGIGPGDRVMLLSDDRPEWHMVDLAVLDLHAVDVPVYGTLTPAQIAYQVKDSGAKVAVAENAEQMRKFLSVRDGCPSLEHLIQIEGPREPGILDFDELAAAERGGSEQRFWDRAAAIDERSLMTIIYTSGTTGEPKGVMLSHHNLVTNVLHTARRVNADRSDLALEFLPLCHVLERMVSYCYMWYSTSKAYCSVVHVGDLIGSIRPTVFTGVPRFYEKVQQKILDKVAAAPPVKRALFDWALGVGREAALRRIAGRELSGTLGARHGLAERLVLSKVREGLGGRLRFCITGGAEMPLHVAEFFHSLGIWMVEGYGLTETSPVISANGAQPGTLRLGTTGRPLDNVEVKLAEDGELLVRGPSVMLGYWNKPEATAEVLDSQGWFSTGDIAEIDDDGFLLIVDRKKDIIVTAGGKNVAPQPIESLLKRSPYVDVAVLIGDRRPYVTALISPNFDELERWAEANRVVAADRADLIEQPRTRQLFGEIVDTVNAGLARYEQIKRFRLLPLALSIDGGHLTPTLKVKRRAVEGTFAHLIDHMYQERERIQDLGSGG